MCGAHFPSIIPLSVFPHTRPSMNATETTRVLLLAPDEECGHYLREMIHASRRDDETVLVSKPDEALRRMVEKPCDIAVVEGAEGLAFIEAVVALGINIAVILVAPDEEGDLIDKARTAGASDALFHSELTPNLIDQAIRYALLWRTKDPEEKKLQDTETRHAELLGMRRTESLSRFVSGMAHEIRNPLSLVLLAADYLAKPRPLAEDARTTLVTYLRDGADRIERIVSSMVVTFAPKQLAKHPHNPVTLVEDALRAVQPQLDATTTIQISKDYDAALPEVLVDRNRIVEVLVHLLDNAIDAMPDGGALTVRVHAYTFTASEREDWQREAWFWAGDTTVIIDFADTGHGIPTDKINHIYEPFFTTKSSSQGAGLGLTAAHKIVQLHSGRISITNRPEGGVLARLVLKSTNQPSRHAA